MDDNSWSCEQVLWKEISEESICDMCCSFESHGCNTSDKMHFLLRLSEHFPENLDD